MSANCVCKFMFCELCVCVCVCVAVSFKLLCVHFIALLFLRYFLQSVYTVLWVSSPLDSQLQIRIQLNYLYKALWYDSFWTVRAL